MQYTNLIWRNGQPYSEMFDDIYYSSDESESISGQSEFDHVFFRSNGLPGRWAEARDFVIAELGFGSGLNCLLTIRQWLRSVAGGKQNKCLHYIAIEKYPLSPEAITGLIARYPALKKYCDELIAAYPSAIKGSHSRFLFNNRVVIHYKFMDVCEALEDENYNVDAWYLDGFAPAKNPAMWSQRLFEMIAQNSCSGTTCGTYTAAGSVRRNLQNAGFAVEKVSGYGKKREMLIAELEECTQESRTFVDKPWFSPPAITGVTNTQATIIGSGIAGLCLAYSLVRRGWTVTLIDVHAEVANATSSNPAAIVYPRLSVNNDIDTQFYTEAYCYAVYVLNMLQAKYREEFWFDTGLLQLADKKRITEIINRFEFNDDYLAITGYIDDKLLRSCSDDDTGKVFAEYKDAGVVLPQVLCDVLLQECGEQIEIIHADVSIIQNDNNHWQCFTQDGLLHETGVLILASGVRLNDIGLEITFPVEKIRGQVAVLKKQPHSESIVKAINTDIYLTPLINGKHYLGATYARGDSSSEADAGENASLIEDLSRIYPGVFGLQSIDDCWVGFRSMARDRIPIVGAVPDPAFFKEEYADIKHGRKDKAYRPAGHLKGLYVTAAHGSRGFTSSFLGAELIASQINAEPCPVSRAVSDYLNPSRFVVNDLKRG